MPAFAAGALLGLGPCPCGAVGAGKDAWKMAFLMSSSLLDSGKLFKHQNWALVIRHSFIITEYIKYTC